MPSCSSESWETLAHVRRLARGNASAKLLDLPHRRLYSYEVVNWYRVRFGDQRYRRYDPSSSPSITTPTAGSVDWTRLSTTGKATLRIAASISEGFSPAEIAASLGIPKEQISKDMAALRWEIHHQR